MPCGAPDHVRTISRRQDPPIRLCVQDAVIAAVPPLVYFYIVFCEIPERNYLRSTGAGLTSISRVFNASNTVFGHNFRVSFPPYLLMGNVCSPFGPNMVALGTRETHT